MSALEIVGVILGGLILVSGILFLVAAGLSSMFGDKRAGRAQPGDPMNEINHHISEPERVPDMDVSDDEFDNVNWSRPAALSAAPTDTERLRDALILISQMYPREALYAGGESYYSLSERMRKVAIDAARSVEHTGEPR